MRIVGLTVLMATFAPSAFAAGGYTEVWNPPEARTSMPYQVRAAHKPAVHRHVVPHAVKVRARRAATPLPKLVAKQKDTPRSVPASVPDMSEIPRLITPEGNVLRVDSRNMSAEVTR